MNKVKMFFIAAALVLTTAGVFAGKAKFDTLTLYVSNNGTSFTQISAASQDLTGLTTTAGGLNIQATIKDRNNNTYGLYAGAGHSPVYSTSAW